MPGIESSREHLSQQIIDSCLAMNAQGINQGSAGNISARYRHGFLITPSGMAYDCLKPEHLVFVDCDFIAANRERPDAPRVSRKLRSIS